jgi:hypothetical protein
VTSHLPPRAQKLGFLVASCLILPGIYAINCILHPFFLYTNTLLMRVPIHILNTYHYCEMGDQPQNCNSFQFSCDDPKSSTFFLFPLAIIDWPITPKKLKNDQPLDSPKIDILLLLGCSYRFKE